MTMMKKIGLNMKSNPTSMLESFIVSENDVQRRPLKFHDHEFGLFKGVHVLIEWMNYSPGWENVSPEQRAIIMSHKAHGFSKTIKPAGMKALDCIGVFENTGDKAGYGFLYQIPICDSEVDIDNSITTLLQLIRNKKCQPLLSDKLRLASVLAQFLGDFHNVGWLHKSFNSNNILFFDIKSSELDRSSILATHVFERPYIVGFHESRLGGKTWHTAGPGSSADFQDYQHPEYVRTRRYRATYDYYSLGLILLELGLWQPLSAWSRSSKCSRMKLTEFREYLIDNKLPFLGAGTGAVYRDVVHFCLSETMNSSEDLDRDILENFAKNVIEPLKELAEMHI